MDYHNRSCVRIWARGLQREYFLIVYLFPILFVALRIEEAMHSADLQPRCEQ